MSMIEQILGEAEASNVILYIKDEQLAFIAEQGRFPSELKAKIGQYKTDIISALLAKQEASVQSDVEPFALLSVAERETLGEGYEDAYPMSALQAGMVFHTQLEGFSGIYHDIMGEHVKCPWDRFCFEQALAACIEQHPILRTGFRLGGERPLQIVHTSIELPLKVEDLRGQSAAAQEQYLEHWMQERKQHVFDWEQGPLLHIDIFLRTDESFQYVISFHHAVLDGWSRAVLTTTLYNRYERLLRGQAVEAVEVDWTYRDFIAQEQRVLSDPAAKAYFSEMLEDVPTQQLPRMKSVSSDVRSHDILAIEGFTSLSGKVVELAMQMGVPVQAVLLAAHFKVLSMMSGQRRAVSCVTYNGRPEAAGAEQSLGLFLNSLPQALEVSRGSWRSLIQQVAEMNAASMQYRGYPLSQIQQDVGISLGEVTFNYTHFHVYEDITTSTEQSLELLGRSGFEQTNFDFHVDVARGVGGNALWMALVYNVEVFDREMVERLSGYYLRAFELMLAGLDELHHKQSLLSDEETQLLLREWNATAREYPSETCLHELFEAQVERNPEAVAIVFDDTELSYRELNEQANQLAHYLRSQKVKADTVVGLCMERSLEMVVGMLGILKAGGGYLPLEPAYPQERLDYMIADSNPALVLTQASLQDRLAGSTVPRLLLDEAKEVMGAYPRSNLHVEVKPEHLAYVIYTSGSTGKPKGVINTHRGICNRLLWMQDAYQLTADDRVLQKTPYTFDVSVWEFFWPLLIGARLVVARPGGHQDTAYLATVISKEQITTMHFVPSMLQLFLDEPRLNQCQSLKRVICSGEALPYALQGRFFANLDAELHNLYGPTEAAVDVTFWECLRHDARPLVPIGKPIANTQIYLLDEHLQPAPLGVPGELHIGGVGVARCYVNKPAQTAEKFIPEPFGDHPGTRLYKTGDSARYLPDGSIEFLGRLDHQVKIRGMRVEPGEIEAAIAEHPAVQEATIVVREHGPNDQQLVAYLVPDQEHAPAVRQLLLLEQDEEFRQQPRYELPNGMTVVHVNKGETDFLYQEIFAEQVYLKHGITLGAKSCIFDVGANIGLFSLFMGQHREGALIYAFEPIPPLFKVLQANAALYGLNARLFDCGLSSQARSETFTYYPHLSIISGRFADESQEREVVKAFINSAGETEAMSESLVDELLTERLASEQFVCQLKTISDVIDEDDVEQIDLLKIDVEKSEMDVLAGIREAHWPRIRQLIVEVHDRKGRLEQVKTLLTRHGYEFTVEQDQALRETELYNIYAIRKTNVETDQSAAATPRWYSTKSLIKDVRESLQDQLPEHMIPQAYVVLAAMPLTPNGKVDRKALPASNGTPVVGEYIAPTTPAEIALAQVWAGLLKLDPGAISATARFFELGGHSLLSLRLLAQIRSQWGVDLQLRDIFEAPQLSSLAVVIERNIGQVLRPPIVALARHTDNLPTSFAQQRLWFIDQLGEGSLEYNMPAALRLAGHFDEDIAEQCLQRIIARHEPLRTVFFNTEVGPRQQIRAAVDFHLTRLDLSGLDRAAQEAAVSEAMDRDAAQAFDLSADVMLRASFLRLSAVEGVLLFNMHHIASDGWSMGILVREFGQLYEAFAAGQPDPLAPLAIGYADYAQWQREWLAGEVLERQLSYWEQQLAELPQVHEVPLDGARPALQSFEGAVHELTLERETVAGLKELAMSSQATLFMVLQGVFALLLSRYSNSDDIVMGVPVANRTQAELEPLVGFFVNTLVLRTDCAGGRTFREYLEQVRQVHLAAQANQDVPFEYLVERLKPQRSTSHAALFQIMFSMNPAAAEAVQLRGLEMKPLRSERVAVKFDLTLEAVEQATGLSLSFAYNRDLFKAKTIERMGEHLRNLLRSVVADAEQQLELLPLLSAREQEHLLREVNATARAYAAETSLHQLFEAQVERSPEAVAVVFENTELNYRELNEQANQLAHYLRAQGVKADSVVGLCVERSVEMVVGLLGILKAGGGYLPLDPTYPQERLNYMIADSAPALVLTQASLDEAKEVVRAYPRSNLRVEAKPENLAYVIYTSGSTGKPKGVMISHAAICNHMMWMQETFPLTESDAVLQKTPFSFDASVWEFYAPLLAGARLVMAQPGGHQDSAYLIRTIEEEKVTTLQTVPSLLRILLAEPELKRCQTLRRWFCGGEPLTIDLQDQLYEQLPAVTLYNLYGPTETTIDASFWECERASEKQVVPIGRPIANTQIYILDAYLQPVPEGVTGEIFISGAGVARGYLNHPELTEERFIRDPFSRNASARMYKTGDLGRRLADGAIEYVGRNDFQIKLRGFRIELGEIEHQIATSPGISAAVVTAREDMPGQKRLVAYITLDGDKQNREEMIATLRQSLLSRLPDYMLPSVFVVLDALPLTPNGKVDHKALPLPDVIHSAGEYVAPNNSTEATLQAIWLAALSIPSLSVTANFFEAGGHSLLAMHLIAQVNKSFGDVLELRDIFQLQTVREMAAYLDAQQYLKKFSTPSNLLELKLSDTLATPLFLVHPVGGYAHCYRELANNLDYHGPVFGLQVDGTVLDTVEAMATKYIEAIKSVQPEGPYLLGGWSMGGVIAFEMAQQLSSTRADVELLLMLDSFCSSSDVSTVDERVLLQVMASEMGITDIGLSSSEREALEYMTLDELLATVLRLGKEQNRLPKHFDLQELKERYAVTRKNSRALRAYRPMPLDIEIQLIRAEENQNVDWDLGWSSVAAKVSVTKQSGNHLSMMHPPHLASLSKTVSALIEAHIPQELVPSIFE